MATNSVIMSRVRCSDKYVFLKSGRRVAYDDIVSISAETDRPASGDGGAFKDVRRLLSESLGDVTVILKDGSTEEYNSQTARRSGAMKALETADLSEISIDALAQTVLSDRFKAREEALRELERRVPGVSQLGGLDREQLAIITALDKAGHAGAASDLLAAAGRSNGATGPSSWEFPEIVKPVTLDGPRLLSAAVGGSTYKLSESKNGGTRVLIKSPGSKHARQTTSLQKPSGDLPKVGAPSLTSSLLGLSSKEDLGSNAILPNENNDPAVRAHNARIAAQFGATYIEWRTGDHALGGSKSSIVAFFKESPAEIAAALFGMTATLRVQTDGTVERVWASGRYPDTALQVDSISSVAELSAAEVRSLVTNSAALRLRTDALRAACQAIPSDSSLLGAQVFISFNEAKIAQALSGVTAFNDEVLSKVFSEISASDLYKVSNKAWLETQARESQQAARRERVVEPARDDLSPREAYVAKYNPRGLAGTIAKGRAPGAIVIDHRGRSYHDGSTAVSDRDVVFESSGRVESYDHPTVIDLQPGEALRIEYGHVRGLIESSIESRGPVRFLASDEIAEAAWQKASSIAERAGVGLAIPEDRAATVDYARSTYNLPDSISYRDLAFGLDLGESSSPVRYSTTPRTIMYDNREVIVIDSTDVPGGELIEGTYEKYGSTQRVLFLADHEVYDPDTRVAL